METSQFHQSILKKNFRLLQRIGRKIDVNIPLNLKGTTALHIASEFLDELDGFKVCKILFQLGGDPNKGDCFGISAVHVAAQNGNRRTLDYLLRNGGNPLQCDNGGHTPYYHAYKNEQVSVMEFLSRLINMDKLHEEALSKKTSFSLWKVETIPIPYSNVLGNNNINQMEAYSSCNSRSSNQPALSPTSITKSATSTSKTSYNSAKSLMRCQDNSGAPKSYSLFSTITYMSSEINAHSCNSRFVSRDTLSDSFHNANTAFLSDDSDLFRSVTADFASVTDDDSRFVTVVEEFIYEDIEANVRLIERRCPGIAALKNCLNKIDNTQGSMHSLRKSGDEDILFSDQESINSLASSIMFMSENCLKSQLASLGFSAGPITAATVHTLHRHLLRLRNNPRSVSEQVCERKYSRELNTVLRNIEAVDWSGGEQLEVDMSELFSNSDSSHAWRCGISKTCFDYILLDPRVTADRKLVRPLTPTERFKYFVSSIFYIGKGTSSRPYYHLHEAASASSRKDISKKTKRIRDIWTTGYGVISLHVFQNIIPAEAWTREAAMISAIGVENITNVLRGSFYGPASTWRKNKQKLLGSFLLYKAFNILIFEGERQIRPHNL